MTRKIQPAKHRILATDTPESMAKRKNVREAVEAEKEKLMAEARRMMKPVIDERKKIAAVLKNCELSVSAKGLA